MKIFKRVVSELLIVILAIVLLFNYEPEEVKAATKPPGRPSITASGTGEPGEVLITIDKVQDADGFCIVAKNDKERSYKKLNTIDNNGKKKTSYTVKNLASGKYVFLVRAYKKAGGKTVWGSYSKAAKLEVGDWPMMYKLVKNGKLGIKYDNDGRLSFTMGYYDMLEEDEQGNFLKDGKKEQLEWLVIDYNEQSGKAFLMSKYLIDKKAFNDELKDITWEECTLREWLNNDFYNMAFNDSEKNLILLSEVINHDHKAYYGPGIEDYELILGGDDTFDRVFLLAYDDAMYLRLGGFDLTAYLCDGCSVGGYWLRSRGYFGDNNTACYVDDKGMEHFGMINENTRLTYKRYDIYGLVSEIENRSEYDEDHYHYHCYPGVRPVLCIDFNQ